MRIHSLSLFLLITCITSILVATASVYGYTYTDLVSAWVRYGVYITNTSIIYSIAEHNGYLYMLGDALVSGDRVMPIIIESDTNWNIQKILLINITNVAKFFATYMYVYNDTLYIHGSISNYSVIPPQIKDVILKINRDLSIDDVVLISGISYGGISILYEGYIYIVGDVGYGHDIFTIDLSGSRTYYNVRVLKINPANLSDVVEAKELNISASGISVFKAIPFPIFNDTILLGLLTDTCDALLLALDVRSWNIVWGKCINIDVSGYAVYPLYVEVYNGTIFLGVGLNETSTGYWSGLVLALDIDGNLLWAKHLAIVETSDSSYYLIPTLLATDEGLYVTDVDGDTTYLFTFSGEPVKVWDCDGHIVVGLDGKPYKIGVDPTTGQGVALDLSMCSPGDPSILEHIESIPISLQVSDYNTTVIDVTDSVSVQSGSSLDIELVENPNIGIEYALASTNKLVVRQPDLDSPVMDVNGSLIYPDTSGVDILDLGLLLSGKNGVETAIGRAWILKVADKMVLFSPVEITDFRIENRKVVVTISEKANISIAVPRNGIAEIVVDGDVLCSSPTACESLRDSDGVIVVDPVGPVTIEIYFASEMSGARTLLLGGETLPTISIGMAVLTLVVVVILVLVRRG